MSRIPWLIFQGRRRGYTRHDEGDTLPRNDQDNDDDSKALLPLSFHQWRHCFKNRFGRKECPLSKDDTEEESRNDDEEIFLATLATNSRPRFLMFHCWRKNQQVDPMASRHDGLSVDSSHSFKSNQYPSPPRQDLAMDDPTDQRTGFLFGEGDIYDNMYQDMSPPRFPVQTRKLGNSPDDISTFQRRDTPRYNNIQVIQKKRFEISRKQDFDEGMMPPSPLETETGVEEESIICEIHDNTDDDTTTEEFPPTEKSVGSEGSEDLNPSHETDLEVDPVNPFHVRPNTLAGYHHMHEDSDASSTFSLESMDSLVASHWDPDDGGSSSETLITGNAMSQAMKTFALSEHLGFLRAKADHHLAGNLL